jgi:hypothetical protein
MVAANYSKTLVNIYRFVQHNVYIYIYKKTTHEISGINYQPKPHNIPEERRTPLLFM